MLICEAAGHDVVIVETVGVGQSETAVAGMTDMFVLMQLPNAGDDLQAIKKGVMELADMVVINKADLDEAAATRARAQITSALRLLGPHPHAHSHPHPHPHADSHPHPHPHPHPHADPKADPPRQAEPNGAQPQPVQVLQLSALKGGGFADFWQNVSAFRAQVQSSGALLDRRHAQNKAWMWERIEAGLRQRFRQHPAVREALPQLTDDVRAGRVAASVAARRLLDLMD